MVCWVDSHVPESGVLWCVGLIHMCLRVVFCGVLGCDSHVPESGVLWCVGL